MRRIVLGTRGSKLALAQAEAVRRMLTRARKNTKVEIRVIRSEGDRRPDEPIPRDSVGFFTREIETALLEERIDLAVHSLKDLPTDPVEGLAPPAVPCREDPADTLLTRTGETLGALAPGSVILTGSPRRRALILHRRPDLVCRAVRGNVQTRIEKMRGSDADGVVLARAGLIRLGLDGQIAQRFDPDRFPPAAGQGALAIQARADDAEAAELCREIADPALETACAAERGYLRALGAGCRTPVGAHTSFAPSGKLRLTAMASTPDGRSLVLRSAERDASGPADAERIGRDMAELILSQGGADIVKAIRDSGRRAP